MRTALSHLTTPLRLHLRQPAALRLLTRPLSSSGEHPVPTPQVQHKGPAQAKANPSAAKSRDASSSSSSDAPARPRSKDEADNDPWRSSGDGASESGTPPVRAAAGGGLMGGRAAGAAQHDYAEFDRGEREGADDAGGVNKRGGGIFKPLLILPVAFGVGLWWSSMQADRGKGIRRRLEETKVGGLGGRERVETVTKKGEKVPPKGPQRIDEVIALE